MEDTIIKINNKKLDYANVTSSYVNNSNVFVIIILVFCILFLSFIYTLAIGFDYEPLKNIEKYKRIKNNINSWKTIIDSKTGIEINKGKLLYLTKPNVDKFQCLDLDSYYVAGRISDKTYLPEFIKKGNSGPWIINKAAKEDESALQFCKYLINKYVVLNSNTSNYITCGSDMFEKLGFSGYFIPNSPCENALTNFK